ncbi:MAG: GNAT family N-acetyltransferase [Rhodobacteraceae bacterium]|nr:GNAT family N-acetyltransferase [Paracoccaceae bacterium]
MTVDLLIRQAKVTDAHACSNILQEWIAETDWFAGKDAQSASTEAVAEEIQNNIFTVAHRADDLVGFSCMEGDILNFLYIASHCQNQGVGVVLLNRCKFANPLGFSLWTFQKNTAARRFYEREGFTEAERSNGDRNEEGLPDIRYFWQKEVSK